MEFAETGCRQSSSDDSWQPCGSRSFLLSDAHEGDGRGRVRIFWIAVFGAIGTLARYGLQGLVQLRVPSAFPYGTLLVNLSGCFFLGLIGQLALNRMMISPDWRIAITVGFFGGYTTFSSFGWETAKMLEDGEWMHALTYVGTSVIVGLLLTIAGIRLANRI